MILWMSLTALAQPPDLACPATTLPTTRWSRAAPKGGRRIAREIGERLCTVDPAAKLAEEATCLQQANQASLDAALAKRGWERLSVEVDRDMMPQAIGNMVGETIPMEPGVSAATAIYLGLEHGPRPCTGGQVLVTPPKAAFVARMPDGGLVAVVPRPEESTHRQHADCSCFPGCGAQQREEIWRLSVPSDALDGPVLGVVQLPYAAVSLAVSAVDTTTCCCVP